MAGTQADPTSHAPVVDYARAEPTVIAVRRDEEALVVLVPPPRIWQSILHALSWGSLVSLGLAIGFVTLSAMAAPADSDRTMPYFSAVAALIGLAIGTILTVVRLIQAALRSKLPALIRVSGPILEVRSPSALAIQSRKWNISDLVDLTLRETGPMRALLRYVRVQIVMTEDRIEEMRLPWNGEGGLALAEESLREAMNLRAPAGLPLVQTM